MYLTTTEIAKNLRNELKATHGYNGRVISVVKVHECAINVAIKDKDIPIEQVRAIAGKHESIDRDANGEILQGGNVFINVRYQS